MDLRPDEHWIFSVYLILPAALGPRVYSASNRNEHEKQKRKIFLGSKKQMAYKAYSLTAIFKLIV
jgi:hypothetical protein